MKIETNAEAITAGIKSLKNDRTGRLVDLTQWAEGTTDCTTDISHLTADDIASQGFSPEEVAALMFIMTQDVMGRAATNADNIDRWLTVNA